MSRSEQMRLPHSPRCSEGAHHGRVSERSKRRWCPQSEIPTLAKKLFSLMTSFTKRPGTSFTLPRERSERGGRHGLEDDECKRTTRAVCGGGESAGKAVHQVVPGVLYLSSHGHAVARALSAVGHRGDRGAQSASAA